MRNRHLIVISFDALSAIDYKHLHTLPNFSQLINNGAYVNNVKTVYPSLTYPAHVSIITGRLPKDHGIINNTLLQPGRKSPDWYWKYKHIKGGTLFDSAKKAGLTTAALLWPVTAKAKIDYNMPEIFPNRPWQNQILVSLFNGSPIMQIQLNNKYGHIRKGLRQPELDDFTLACTLDLIKNKRPNLMMIHFTDLDTQRHHYGFDSNEAIEAIKRHDARLGKIIKTIKDARINDNTTIVALGDHSQIDESKVISLNTLFVQNSLIQLDKGDDVKNWQAYVKSCDGSAYVYLKNSIDKGIKSKVDSIINSFMQNPDCGIEKVYSANQAAALGADPNCYLMLEAKKDYYFIESTKGEVIENIYDASIGKKVTKAAHGYHPDKPNYGTCFMAAGKSIKKGKVIDKISLIDEGPTFAELLGIKIDNSYGRVIQEILE